MSREFEIVNLEENPQAAHGEWRAYLLWMDSNWTRLKEFQHTGALATQT